MADLVMALVNSTTPDVLLNGSHLVAGLEINATDCGDPCKPHYEFYEQAQFVTGLIVFPIFCFFGLMGNIFIIIVLLQKSSQTSTNVYLTALAVSDTIKLINDSLYFLTVFLLRADPPSGNKAFGYLYPYAHFIFNMSTCVSSWLTVSVAVERYILVCHPTKSKGLITIQRARVISTAVFVIMTSVAVPSALRYKIVENVELQDGRNVTMLGVELTELWQNEKFVVAYNWVQSLLRSIIPLFILIAMNFFIISALRKTRANKKLASRNKITLMLIIVIVFFIFCITPDAIMSSFFNLGYTESKNFLVKGVREITDSLLGVNAAVNYFLYMIFNKIFRDQFMQLFCKQCVKDRDSEDPKYRRLAESSRNCSNGVSLKKKQTSAM